MATSEYYKNNKEAIIKRTTLWNISNPDRRKEIEKKYRDSHKGKVRSRKTILNRYNISIEEYDKLFSEQKGVCAICNSSETLLYKGQLKNLSVDHCHTSGKIRALLCNRCNVLLGKAADDIELMRKAILYLEKHFGY